MSKMILKQALILSLFTLSMSVQADQNKELLVNRCHELAKTVKSLVVSQHNPACVDKLVLASNQMSVAAALISDDSVMQAKQIVVNAVKALQFAELTGCIHYIQISHSKLEANKLRHLL
ncbi:hypothetical protein [Legionella saoudiensis]|uniref:hypothetical protein n=1 Tax=Legionella saoudiensis TaxID=1750561 RepID=UPI0007311F64|nr:hypothetical protein [Legionella saoudiensis]